VRLSKPEVHIGAIAVLLAVALSPATVAAWEVDATATVTRVIDGDTFDSSPAGRVRLADIDAAESSQPGYEASRDFLAGLVDGQLVYLDVDDVYVTDPYNRLVAVVYVRYNASHLQNVNRALLDAGMAVVTDYPNEFNPAVWTPYVYHPSAPPPSPNPLTLSASANPTEGTAPLTVTFAASASGGTPPYVFLWDFGDGSTSSVQNPAHAYASARSYAAQVTVTDAVGNTMSRTILITVSAPTLTTSGAVLSTEALFLAVVIAIALAAGGLWLRFRRVRGRFRRPPKPE